MNLIAVVTHHINIFTILELTVKGFDQSGFKGDNSEDNVSLLPSSQSWMLLNFWQNISVL